MAGYTKLFSSILASTIWKASDKVRIVWITLLAMADKNGVAEGSIPGLADFAHVSLEDAEEALRLLQQPDKYSRSQEHEGRRIQPIDGGWLILNHGKYRAKMSADERREYNRQKQAEHRERQRESKRVNDGKLQSALSAHSDSDSDSDSKRTQFNSLEALKAGQFTEWKDVEACLAEVFGKNTMFNWGGLWCNRWKENPEKFSRLFADYDSDIKEGKQITNPGGYIDDLWKRFA